jgi:hypothetical protein
MDYHAWLPVLIFIPWREFFFLVENRSNQLNWTNWQV